jgi:hypothetical protein
MTDEIAAALAACRKRFGPNYAGPVWRAHHDELCPLEWTHNADERIDYIVKYKPAEERVRRLDAFRPVVGELPEEVVEARLAYTEARRACDEAWRALDEARRALDEARQACAKAWRAMDAAGRACDEARRADAKAGRAYGEAIAKHNPAIEALYAKECPDLPGWGEPIC